MWFLARVASARVEALLAAMRRRRLRADLRLAYSGFRPEARPHFRRCQLQPRWLAPGRCRRLSAAAADSGFPRYAIRDRSNRRAAENRRSSNTLRSPPTTPTVWRRCACEPSSRRQPTKCPQVMARSLLLGCGPERVNVAGGQQLAAFGQPPALANMTKRHAHARAWHVRDCPVACANRSNVRSDVSRKRWPGGDR